MATAKLYGKAVNKQKGKGMEILYNYIHWFLANVKQTKRSFVNGDIK